MDPLRATIEEFAAEGYTHIACSCPRCRVIRLRPMSWLPKISMGLTLAALSARLRCAECGGPLQSVKPWRQEDALGKPLGRRG
jgi:hypothetical protein